jgi:hypothetical protein
MAQEIAEARREAARLRVENAQLLNRVFGLERRGAGAGRLGNGPKPERR